jgi:hypothetical protein
MLLKSHLEVWVSWLMSSEPLLLLHLSSILSVAPVVLQPLLLSGNGREKVVASDAMALLSVPLSF